MEDTFQLVGKMLEGNIRVDAVVDRGGCGIVYRGRDLGFDRDVALKCLLVRQSLEPEQQATFLKSFQQEAQLLYDLANATSRVVRVNRFNSFAAPDGSPVPYLVLEWLDGLPLDDWLVQRRERAGAPHLPLEEMVALLGGAAEALAVAHKRLIAHRDVKPSNIFVLREGTKETVKVLDFGVAKLLQEGLPQSQSFTQVGTLSAYTHEYGAPEQFERSWGTTGYYTDVFAFALVCVEALTGVRALSGDHFADLHLSATRLSPRPTPRTRGALVSDAVERVFQRALAVRPDDRHPDLGEFWKDLCTAGGFPRPAWIETTARPPAPAGEPGASSPQNTIGSRAAPTGGAVAVTVPTRRLNRSVVAMLSGLGVLLLGGGIAALVALRGGDVAPDLRISAASAPRPQVLPAHAPDAPPVKAAAPPDPCAALRGHEGQLVHVERDIGPTEQAVSPPAGYNMEKQYGQESTRIGQFVGDAFFTRAAKPHSIVPCSIVTLEKP